MYYVYWCMVWLLCCVVILCLFVWVCPPCIVFIPCGGWVRFMLCWISYVCAILFPWCIVFSFCVIVCFRVVVFCLQVWFFVCCHVCLVLVVHFVCEVLSFGLLFDCFRDVLSFLSLSCLCVPVAYCLSWVSGCLCLWCLVVTFQCLVVSAMSCV